MKPRAFKLKLNLTQHGFNDDDMKSLGSQKSAPHLLFLIVITRGYRAAFASWHATSRASLRARFGAWPRFLTRCTIV
jgi:hypothetical protein